MLTQRDDLVPHGEILLSIDRDVPFSVVMPVLYTAGQCQLDTFLVVTHNPWLDAPRVVEVALPRLNALRFDDDIDGPVPLNLMLVVDDRGVTLLGADRVLHPDGRPADPDHQPTPDVTCAAPCSGVDDYDRAQLNRLLGQVKANFPDDLQILVVPDPAVSFDVLVRALDAARWAPYVPLDADPATWEQWRSDRDVLFDQPILARGAQ